MPLNPSGIMGAFNVVFLFFSTNKIIIHMGAYEVLIAMSKLLTIKCAVKGERIQ